MIDRLTEQQTMYRVCTLSILHFMKIWTTTVIFKLESYTYNKNETLKNTIFKPNNR